MGLGKLPDGVKAVRFNTRPGLQAIPTMGFVNQDESLRNVIKAGKGRIPPEEFIERCRRAQKLGLPSLHEIRGHESGIVAICGGGPSLLANIPRLRALRVVHKADIIGVNKTPDWLESGGLKDGKKQFNPFLVKYGILLDPKDWVADYITPKPGRRYLLASQVADRTFEKFKKYEAYLWHAEAKIGEVEMLKKEFAHEEWCVLPGASVVGLRAVFCALFLGYREIHLFGIDAAGTPPTDTSDGKLYSYDKPHIDETFGWYTVKPTTGWEKDYWANHHMARSAYEFEDMIKSLHRGIQEERIPPFKLRVHGDPDLSAVAFLAATYGIHADQKMNDKYGKSPDGKPIAPKPDDTPVLSPQLNLPKNFLMNPALGAA